MTKKKAARPAGSVLRCFNKRPENEQDFLAGMNKMVSDNVTNIYREIKPVLDNLVFGNKDDKSTALNLCVEGTLHKAMPEYPYTLYFISIDMDSLDATNASLILPALCATIRGSEPHPLVQYSVNELKRTNNEIEDDIVCYCCVALHNYEEFIKECIASKHFCICACFKLTEQDKNKYKHEVESLGRRARFISIKGTSMEAKKLLETVYNKYI